MPVLPPDQWLQENTNGSWAVRPALEQNFDRELKTAREKFIEERTKFFRGPAASREGGVALAGYSVQLSLLRQVRAALDEALRKAMETRSRQAADGRAAADAALAPARAVAEQAVRQLPAPLQPWDAPAWVRMGVVSRHPWPRRPLCRPDGGRDHVQPDCRYPPLR